VSRTLHLALAVVVAGLVAPRPMEAQVAVVHAVLFYSPTCPHCHKVITEDLPPLVDKYGSQLVVAGVDVTTQQGQMLYQATVRRFGIPESRLGVPTLVVGSEVMVGELEIPQRFPGLIEKGLAAGGTDWPPVDAIRQALARQGMLQDRATPDSTDPDSVAVAERAARAADSARVADSLRAAQGARASDSVAARSPTAPPQVKPAPAPRNEAPRPVRTDTAPGMIPTPGVSQRVRGGADSAGPAPGARAPAATADTPLTSDTARSARSAGTTDSAAGVPEASAGPSSAETGIGRLTEEAAPEGMAAKFGLDPVANTIAVVILLGMLVAIFASVRSVVAGAPPTLVLPSWTMPALAAVGMAVASYLALVEITHSEAVCGPVGNCNAVQQSPWATLFGFPVGVLGQAGYLAMFGAWVLGVLGPRRWGDSAWLALWVMALAGTAFSVYLTFLEPFVIGATCLWCVTSAVVMTLMLHGATPRARALRLGAGS
jgi:uncharacterized membrane protein/thiol-disulfide isomerase/thioredoxin